VDVACVSGYGRISYRCMKSFPLRGRCHCRVLRSKPPWILLTGSKTPFAGPSMLYRVTGPLFDTSTALEMLGFTGWEVREGLASHLDKRKPWFPKDCPI